MLRVQMHDRFVHVSALKKGEPRGNRRARHFWIEFRAEIPQHGLIEAPQFAFIFDGKKFRRNMGIIRMQVVFYGRHGLQIARLDVRFYGLSQSSNGRAVLLLDTLLDETPVSVFAVSGEFALAGVRPKFALRA